MFNKLAILLIFSVFLSVNVHSNKTTINVGIDLWPGYYPIVLAKQLGYFDKRDLDVNFVLPESTGNMLEQFTDGKLDLVCVAMGDAFSLYKKDNGLRIVMITDESAGGDALLSKDANAPIEGKIIGTNLNGFGALFVNTFLRAKNINQDSVTLVHQEAADALSALQSGKADIVHTWEPYVTEIKSFNMGEIAFDSSQTPGLIPDALLANGQFINDHSGKLALFIEAWHEAAQWWLDNSDQGNQIIESELVMMPGSVSLDGVKLYTIKDNIMAFKKGESMKSLHYTTQLYIDFFSEKGLIEPTFKPLDIIDDRFVLNQ